MERLISRKGVGSAYIEFFKEKSVEGRLQITRYVKLESSNAILSYDYLTIDDNEYQEMLNNCLDFESLHLSLEFYFQRVMACI